MPTVHVRAQRLKLGDGVVRSMGVKPPKVPLERAQLPASNRTSYVFLVMRPGRNRLCYDTDVGSCPEEAWEPGTSTSVSHFSSKFPKTNPTNHSPAPFCQWVGGRKWPHSSLAGPLLSHLALDWTDTSSQHGTQAVLVLPIPPSFRVEAAPTPPLKASPGRTGQRSVGET